MGATHCIVIICYWLLRYQAVRLQCLVSLICLIFLIQDNVPDTEEYCQSIDSSDSRYKLVDEISSSSSDVSTDPYFASSSTYSILYP